jgi:hypothetical protein
MPVAPGRAFVLTTAPVTSITLDLPLPVLRLLNLRIAMQSQRSVFSHPDVGFPAECRVPRRPRVLTRRIVGRHAEFEGPEHELVQLNEGRPLLRGERTLSGRIVVDRAVDGERTLKENIARRKRTDSAFESAE